MFAHQVSHNIIGGVTVDTLVCMYDEENMEILCFLHAKCMLLESPVMVCEAELIIDYGPCH